MAKKSVHTVRHGGGWANRRAGSKRVSATFRTKEAAQRAGRKTAMRERVEHVIHNRDGKMGGGNSYGGDPFPPRG